MQVTLLGSALGGVCCALARRGKRKSSRAQKSWLVVGEAR